MTTGDKICRSAAWAAERMKHQVQSMGFNPKFKPLAVTLAAAAVCSLIAYVAVLRQDAAFAPEERETVKLLNPSELAALASPSKVALSFAGRRLTLQNAGKEGWNIAEKGKYPADPSAVRVFLAGLTEAERAEKKTDDPVRYGKLGLDPSGAVKAEIYGPSGGREISLFFGGQVQGRGVYVRRDGEKEVWLAAKAPVVSAEFTSWIQTKPFAADEDAVTAVEARPLGGEEYRLERRTANGVVNWAMESVPEGYSVKDQTSLRSVAAALSYLYIEDAAPEAAKKDLFKNGTSGATFYMKDGGVIMTEAAQAPAGEDGKPGEVWVQFTAIPPPPEPSDPAAKKEEPLLDYDYIARLTEGRVFRTPDFVARDLSKTRDDLLQKIGGGEAAAEAPGEPAAEGGETQPAD